VASPSKTVFARLDPGDPVDAGDYWITRWSPSSGGAPRRPAFAGDDGFALPLDDILIEAISRDG
jgi:hypothetical protein